MTRLPFVLAALCLTAAGTVAQDGEKAVTAQKATAKSNLKRAGAEKAVAVETDDLLVFAAVPEGKAKPIAEAAQKAFAFAKGAMKFEESETLWPGKLTVYVLPNRSQYTAFVRAVEQRQPDKAAWYGINTRADPPYVLVGEELGEKSTDAEQQADAAAVVAAAVLARKAGVTPDAPLPEWLLLGFGRAAHARAEGGRKLADFRAKTKAAVLGTKSRPLLVRAADVWDGAAGKGRDLIAASLTEYLAFGPDAAKFPAFLAGFKPTEAIDAPTVANALEAAGWKPEAIEAGWKRWVATGK